MDQGLYIAMGPRGVTLKGAVSREKVPPGARDSRKPKSIYGKGGGRGRGKRGGGGQKEC